MTLSIPIIDIYSAAVAIMLALLMGLAFGAAMVLTLRAEQRLRRRGSWALPGALWLAGPAPGPVCKLERQLVRTAEYSLKTVMVPVCSSP